MNNVLGLDGKPKQPTGPVYHMRLCLVGSDDIDIKNVQTFGIAEDGFFMVKSHDNTKLPVFMTNPASIQTVEIYKEGDEPVRKVEPIGESFTSKSYNKDHATDISFENEKQQTLKNNHNQDI